ncbi:MAG TPA: FAD-dependent oxidoreductase [Leadbetterella sp.]|nr:FAD-dependent oxidoreductase [Leadbetterella sp.]
MEGLKKYDFIVVGHGLAGALVANELLDKGQKILVFGDPNLKSSSMVAGGMVNPVTGKYLAKTWLIDELFGLLFDYYRNLENDLKATFLHQTGLFRPFANQENKQNFLKQIEKNQLQDYLEVQESPNQYAPHYEVNLGGMFTEKAGWVDLPVMLAKIKDKLVASDAFHESQFDHSQLEIAETGFTYSDIFAEKIIFCEGYYATQNPYFNWLPFNPVKGETLLANIQDYNIGSIVNQGKWIMPLGGGKVRIGATYSWHELDFETTDKGREELTATMNKVLKTDYEIIGQQAGVRPSTKDRRPILGVHPKHKNMFVFNGLGTKGVSLAPYFVKQLLDFIFLQKDINPEANIERHYALYS